MRNDPTKEELWRRVELADDTACGGGYQDSDCPFCRRILELLRGSVDCEECGHINALGHDCDDWDCDRGARHEEWEASEPRRYCRFVGTRKQEGRTIPTVAMSNPTRVWWTEPA